MPAPTVTSSLPRRRPVGALVVAVWAVVASLVVACGPTSPDALRDALVVPVLWAAESGGTVRGGVEPARVAVVDGDGGFAVDLSTEQARGAGPQWLAASGTAATVGTLASATDPRTIDITFGITGPIDGPSGGAALTVGVLAAIRGLALRDGVTMTGTISPDGSVGRVGQVPAKVRAAADAGYDLVLVPVANAADRDPDTGVDVVALGASLGIEVRPVADLGAAMAAFTGEPITAGGGTAPPLVPAVAAVAGRITPAMVERLDAAVRDAAVRDAAGRDAAGAGAAARDRATAQLAAARAALAAGNLPGAYGAAADGVLGLARAVASQETVAAAAAAGVVAARPAVEAEAASVAAAADAALAQWSTGADGDLQTAARKLGAVSALGWLTYARAAAAGSGAAATEAISPAELGGLAGTIAEQRVAVEVMWPDAAAIVATTDDAWGSQLVDPDSLLDGYTGLLVAASDANQQYLDAVLSSSQAAVSPADPAVVATGVLRDLATGDAAAVVRASAAMSWWFVTSSMVAGRQAFGLDALGLGGDIGVPANQAVIDASVRNAADTVTAAAATLADRGVDPSAPVWSATWGEAAAAADRIAPVAAGEVIALGELWYSVITVFMLLAASAPAT